MKTKKDFEDEIIKDEVVKEIVSLNDGRAMDVQIRPNLALLMIGDDEKSAEFIDGIEKEAIRVGIDTHTYVCPKDSDAEEIEAMIFCLNEDELIDGVFMSLPLPNGFDEEMIRSLIDPDKDLTYLLEGSKDKISLQEAKLFRAVLDNFKMRRGEGESNL